MAIPKNDACLDLQNSNNILGELEIDLRKLGYAGPADFPKLIYLVLQSRRFKRVVSLVLKGPSGSGKSFALSQALKFVPPATYEYFGGMSEKAIVYSGLNLEHKHLVIGEAAGLSSGDGRAFLRQLLSEGELRYLTVQKTDKGLSGAEVPRIKGPMGLIMTTTANALHPEDESRMLSLSMPESADQTRLALLSMAKGVTERYEVDFERWFALDKITSEGCTEVAIPFAEQIAMQLPVTHHRVQRDFPQLLSLISSHALLHKCIRPRADDGAIMANLEDYSAVYSLVNSPFSEGLETAVAEPIRKVVEAVKELSEEGKTNYAFENKVSQGALAKKLGRDQSVISRTLESAIANGYLRNENPGQGKIASIVLGERDLPQGYALPDPETIAAT